MEFFMEKDLTTGKITPQLIGFTIPLVLGNLFQLTYNAVDSIIVGRYVGKEALAAVGICNPISTLFILFLNGLCMGASILMGNQFGAKDYDRLHRQISTTMLSGIAFSLILSVLCIVFARPILLLMQVDASIMGMTINYLRIIFAGLLFTFMYNCFASTLRALGDSQSPLYFLITSAVINILGDLFFVLFLNMGSEGCAISTVLVKHFPACCVSFTFKKKCRFYNWVKNGWYLIRLCLAKRFPTAGHLPCSRQPSSLESLGFRQLSIPWVLPLPPHLPL